MMSVRDQKLNICHIPSLLQPLPLPSQAWTSISMDFIEELPRLLGTTLSLQIAYHPQMDGQTESVNQCVENYLRCMCHLRPKQWNKWLSLVEYWYNTNFHTGLKLTHFQALYGYLLGRLTIDPYIPISQPEVEEYLNERIKILELLKLNLAETQNIMKMCTNKHWEEMSFVVGNYVYLKLQPYRLNSWQLWRNLKLAPKYYGPFQVIEKIGELDDSSREGTFQHHKFSFNGKTIQKQRQLGRTIMILRLSSPILIWTLRDEGQAYLGAMSQP
ncbi:UNVERIFIED_CONTAM: hypothetical protein Sradi_7159500 [Sesamum radiatum]|uniref:Tf2-1-like SH3-like domain-containing protein n=1 Tax=Sesamum radiatum TaxID=300843 RepID=A0AAW2IX10_SESRA